MQTELPIASGLTPEEWVKLLDGRDAVNSLKALRYLDGDQEEQMEALLSDPYKGRKKWRERGLIARFRNITQMIVSKSGMLFKDVPPTLEVYDPDARTPNEAKTQALYDELNKTEWVETFTSLDQLVRLLKTGMLLIQYSAEEQQLVFDVLSRANTQVVINPSTRQIDSLIYQTSEYGEVSNYRIITKDQYIDLRKDRTSVTVVGSNPNPYGIIPVVAFYDTTSPRNGFWNEPAMDLVGLNELVNLSIIDSEYAISWSKLPSLFTNCRIMTDNIETVEYVQGSGPFPTMTAGTELALLGGPSKVIQLDSAGVDSPIIEYKTPKVDISPLDDVIEKWIKNYAKDWSVRVASEGSTPSSGFSLLVEEIDNLDLRKRRQRQFENAFKRFYRVVATVVNTVKPGTFDISAELFATFADPYLPVDLKAQEEVWNMRIAEARASDIDYLVETQGLSREEAEDKLKQIAEDKKFKEKLYGTEEDKVEAPIEEEVKEQEVQVVGEPNVNQ